VTRRVPQLGQRLRMEEKVSPQRRHFTSGNMGITGSSVLFQLQEDII
jgi:hypothetical protein